MTLSAIIIDDERLARELVREFLEKHPQISILAECDTGDSAILKINQVRPDIIFLDIQMPGKSGFEVLEELEEIPLVVFSTAYAQYALQAFEVSAVDYLLKPYDQNRFDQAVNRLIERGSQSEELSEKLQSLLQNFQDRNTYHTKLFVKYRNRIIPVKTRDLQWIEAQGDYAMLHTESKAYLTNFTLNRLEEMLDPTEYIRIHRSSIVKVSSVKELLRKESGGYSVLLTSGTELPVGRTRLSQLKLSLI